MLWYLLGSQQGSVSSHPVLSVEAAPHGDVPGAMVANLLCREKISATISPLIWESTCWEWLEYVATTNGAWGGKGFVELAGVLTSYEADCSVKYLGGTRLRKVYAL